MKAIICFLSNNQYDIDEELGNGDWRQSSFYLALQSTSVKGTCMVLDDQAIPLTRAWFKMQIMEGSFTCFLCPFGPFATN